MSPTAQVTKSPTNKPCALILVAMVLGVVIDRYLEVPIPLSLTVAIVAAFSFLLIRFCFNGSSVQFASVLLLIGWMASGTLWHHVYHRLSPKDEIGRLISDEPQPAILKAWVVSRPRHFPATLADSAAMHQSQSMTRVLVSAVELKDGMKWLSVSGRVSVRINGLSRFSVGDELILAGRLGRPKPARNPGDFDLRVFYRSRQIHTLLFVDGDQGIQKTGRTNAWLFGSRILERIADQCVEIIDRAFSNSTANLIRAMLLGERHRVPKSQQDLFLVTGTMHLLAISGLHVGILSSGWLLFLRTGLLPRLTGYWLTLTFVVVYCLLVGARPPVVRATVLVVIFCLAKISGREPLSVNSLCLAGLSILCLNPVAIFQPGPQLSFVAVAVLILLGDRTPQPEESEAPLARFPEAQEKSLAEDS